MHAQNFKAISCNGRAVQQLWNGKKKKQGKVMMSCFEMQFLVFLIVVHKINVLGIVGQDWADMHALVGKFGIIKYGLI